ncbi:cell division protein ZapA [Candidatus Aerophobetes bacterium]|nr:cell division protein ZapA [Candidatus Aerophobetes bacterium]
MKKVGIKVYIFDREYNLKANQDEEYLKAIASFVDNEMRRIASSLPGKGVEEISILACLNIADEFYKLRKKSEVAREKIKKLIKRIEKDKD